MPARTKVRLCLAPGTWQLIMLSAALAQRKEEAGDDDFENVLVLFDPAGSESLLAWMHQLAPRLGSWSRIVSGNPVLTPQYPEEEWPWPIERYASDIRTAWNASRADELWISQIEAQPYRLAIEAYPDARLILYEDGLLSSPVPARRTAAQWRHLLRSFPGLVRRGAVRSFFVSERVALWTTPRRYICAVSEIYLFICDPQLVPSPYSSYPRRVIGRSKLLAAVHAVAGGPSVSALLDAVDPARPDEVLFLAQPISNMMTLDERRSSRVLEVEFYQGVIRDIVDRGYRVCWKDHPRYDPAVYDDISRGFTTEQLRRTSFPPQLPVEVAAGKLGFKMVVSITSSSLFYLPRLFGMKSFSCARRFISRVSAEMSRYLALPLIISELPDIDRLPALPKGESN